MPKFKSKGGKPFEWEKEIKRTPLSEAGVQVKPEPWQETQPKPVKKKK